MIGDGKNHFSCKWRSNQERMETEKKTFVTDVSQIRKEWKRKKNFCASRQSNQERMETEKKTFVRQGKQIRKEWERKKKLFCVMPVKSGKIGNRKN